MAHSMHRQPLAPIVWENGVPTYAAPFPADFFTRIMLQREMMAYHLGLGPAPTVQYAA